MKWNSQFCCFVLLLLSHFSSGSEPTKKIAFLFLTRGLMPFEEVWKEFFTWRADPSQYTIYIHAHMGYTYGNNSVFHNKEIAHHGEVEWGGMSQVRAIRKLVRHALEDPLNQWFTLMSESCIPLLPLARWRSILFSHNQSIINACNHDAKWAELDTRWRPTLDTIGFNKDHWRKSATWFALIRKHAQVYADTTNLDKGWENVPCCDEHFLPSLLASHNFDEETTCSDGFVHANFPTNAAHPVTYWPADIVPELFVYLQKALGTEGFSVKCSGFETCHFIARKFSPTSKYALLKNIHLILDEPGVPYTGNAMKHLEEHLRKDETTNEYFLFEHGKLRKFPNHFLMDHMGLDANKAVSLSKEELANVPHGPDFFCLPEGAIVKRKTAAEVFVVKNGTLHGIPSMAAFDKLGYQWSELRTISDGEMGQMTIGEPMKEPK